MGLKKLAAKTWWKLWILAEWRQGPGMVEGAKEAFLISLWKIWNVSERSGCW